MKREAAFLGLYNKGFPLYKGYQNLSDVESKVPSPETLIPTLLMINRWDGKIGFPGGHIDPGETPLGALKRELLEEMGYLLVKEPRFISRIDAPNTILHFYALEVPDFKELRSIVRDSLKAEHYGSEVTGVFLQHLKTYRDNKGLATFLQGSSLVYGVKEEIASLVEYLNLSE